MGRPTIDLTGKTFGLLTVIERDWSKPRGSGKEAYWLCICKCGGSSSVRSTHLTTGHISSCGCREGRIRHGEAKGSGTALYRIWGNMRRRCNDPSNDAYAGYGGRGIRVDPRWDDFEVFRQDVGPRPGPEYTLDRINNDGNYEPDNVRWATRKEQARNTRANVMITYDGRTQSLIEWAEETGLNWSTILSRLNRGWSVEDALTISPWPHKRTKKASHKHFE